MSVLVAPLQSLVQDLLSSVKIGWGADRGRVNLTASDPLMERCSTREVHLFRSDENKGQRAYRIGAKDAEGVLRWQAEQIFSTPYSRFTAHSGHQANKAVLKALLEPGDPVICLPDPELENALDTLYVSAYTPRLRRYSAVCHANHVVDYDALAQQIDQIRPRCLVAGYTSYTRHLDYRALRQLADSVGARLVVDISRVAGLVAAELIPNPIEYADVVTGASHKSLQGPRGGFFMSRDAGLFNRISTSLAAIGHGSVPHRLLLTMINCLNQAKSPLQIARHQLSLRNARVMASTFEELGLDVVCGGTDVHSIALNLRPLNLSVQQAAAALARLGITIERGEAPHLVISTFPISARGFDTPACQQLAWAIGTTLKHRNDLKTVARGIAAIDSLCAKHPPLVTALDYLNLQ